MSPALQQRTAILDGLILAPVLVTALEEQRAVCAHVPMKVRFSP